VFESALYFNRSDNLSLPPLFRQEAEVVLLEAEKHRILDRLQPAAQPTPGDDKNDVTPADEGAFDFESNALCLFLCCRP